MINEHHPLSTVSSVEVKPKKLNNKQKSRTYRTLVVKPQRSLKCSSYCYRFQKNLISMVIIRLLIVSFYTSTNRWTATIVNKSSKYPQKKCFLWHWSFEARAQSPVKSVSGRVLASQSQEKSRFLSKERFA